MGNKPTYQVLTQGSRMVTCHNLGLCIQDTLGFPIASGNSFNALGPQWFFMFMGYAPINFGVAVSKFYLKGVHDWSTAYAGAYCEMGMYTGEVLIGKNTVLNRLAVTNMFPTVSKRPELGGTAGNVPGYRNILLTPDSTVSAGTPIWIGMGYYAGAGGSGALSPAVFPFANGEIMVDISQLASVASFNSSTQAMSSPTGKSVYCFPSGSGVNFAPNSHWICSLTYYQSRAI